MSWLFRGHLLIGDILAEQESRKKVTSVGRRRGCCIPSCSRQHPASHQLRTESERAAVHNKVGIVCTVAHLRKVTLGSVGTFTGSVPSVGILPCSRALHVLCGTVPYSTRSLALSCTRTVQCYSFSILVSFGNENTGP